jgi:exodeoxyribonuclease V beta subunit
MVALLAGECRQLDDDAMYGQLEQITLADLPEAPGEILFPPPEQDNALTFHGFSGNIDRSWRVVSFSSLVAGMHQQHAQSSQDSNDEERDYDRLSDPAALWSGAGGDRILPGEAGQRDIFSFPRGARAGTLLHEILRYLDFQHPDAEEAAALVSRKLAVYGFPAFWQETVVSLLRKVVALPLLPFSVPAAGGGDQPYTLASLAMRDRLNELEFYFPLRRLAPEDLQGMLGETIAVPRSGEEESSRERRDFALTTRRLHFSPARGFMRGFMDMAFCRDGRYYLVDWKSNHLGNQVGDYGPDAVARAMKENYYILQYHLYCLALHLYLGARLPDYSYDRHFGGVYYFFLRGIDPAAGAGYGLYRDRPPEELITELAAKLIAPR